MKYWVGTGRKEEVMVQKMGQQNKSYENKDIWIDNVFIELYSKKQENMEK